MTWKKALTDEQERRLVVDHQDGIRVVELVRRYEISESTVYRILADHGSPRTLGPRNKKRRPLRAKAKGRVLKPCGTNAAYARHKRNGEYPCTPCVEAHAAEQMTWSKGRKDS